MIALSIFAVLAAIVGIIGSIVPGLPGPPISWIGILLAYLASRGGDDPISTAVLFVWLAVVAIVTSLDYVIPSWTTKAAGGHKAASMGAIVGLFAGLFLTPIGMIAGAFIGAVLGELLVTDKGAWPAFKAGFGAFMGFIAGTMVKLVTTGIMLWVVLKHII